MYQTTIANYLIETGREGRYDPRQIEAYMRIEHPALDALSPVLFYDEVELAIAVIDVAGQAQAELVAQSFGF